MFDVGVVGVGSLLGALATIALGLLGTFVGLIVGLSRRQREGSRGVASYCAGPLACLAIGCLSIALVEGVPLSITDAWTLAWPGAGIGSWLAIELWIRLTLRRATRAGATPR